MAGRGRGRGSTLPAWMTVRGEQARAEANHAYLAAKSESSAAEHDGLPDSWRKVPSKSRKGEFSYLHLPTGLKQKGVPAGEPSEAEIAAFVAGQGGLGVRLGTKESSSRGPCVAQPPQEQEQEQERGSGASVVTLPSSAATSFLDSMSGVLQGASEGGSASGSAAADRDAGGGQARGGRAAHRTAEPQPKPKP